MISGRSIKQITSGMAILAIFQGLYYLITGLWPIIHIDSFMAITGPKEEIWLVKTVGMLVFFIGAGLFTAGAQKKVSFPLIVIAAGTTVGFILVDVIYVVQRVLWATYLLDAVIEFLLLSCWVVLLFMSGEQQLFTNNRSGHS